MNTRTNTPFNTWLPPRARLALITGSVLVSLVLSACQSSASRSTAAGRGTASTPSIVATGPVAPVAIVDGKERPVPPIKLGDPRTIERILDEGKYRNQVMDHLRELTEVRGPRLTGSSRAEDANRWAMSRFQSWGLESSLHQWGTIPTRFDRGPSTAKILVKETKKNDAGGEVVSYRTVRDMQFTTLAWTKGTDGPVRGRVFRMPDTEDEYTRIKPELKGAWLLIKPTSIAGRTGVRAGGLRAGDRFKGRIEAREKVAGGTDPSTLAIEDRVLFDGIAGFISASRDDKDRVWTTAAPKWRERTIDQIPPDVEMTVRLSDYDHMNSRLHDGDEFYVEADLKHTLTPGPIPVYNTIAEIKGTTKPDEVVIICGHLDSWDGPGSQGTLDNAVGSAVTIEAARLLAVTGARPARTIRFCLWTGEEQGLLGSKQYVKDLGENINRVCALFNDDGGTNYQGGLKTTADMREVLAAATAPVNKQFIDSADGKPMTVNIQTLEKFSRFAASDHYSFVEAGAPGFYWDEVGRSDYSYGWHTQHDRFDLAIPEYLMQSATCAAITAYNVANAPELFPRIPVEKPDPAAAPAIPPAGNAPAK